MTAIVLENSAIVVIHLKKITMRFYVNMMNGSSWFFQNISEIDRCNESAFFLLDFLKFFKLLKCDNTFTGDLEITEQSYI